MKRTFCKTLGVLALCLTLLTGLSTAYADSLLGLDGQLSQWLSQDVPLRFSGVKELQTFLPFTEKQLPMFNDLLQHMAFQSSLEQDGDGSVTTLQMLCDDTPVYMLTERQQGDDFSLETSLLPNYTLQSNGQSPIDALAHAPQQESPFTFLTAISQAQSHYQALIDACEPYAEKKRANYKIADIGTSKWSQIARLTTEQSDSMLPLLRSMLQSGMDPAYCEELNHVRFGKGFIVGLYKVGENDKDLAVYLKGDLLYPDGSTYALKYQWAFVDKGTQRKDSYKYDAVKGGSPKLRRTVEAFATQTLLSDELSMKGNSETILRGSGTTDVQNDKFSLTGKATGDTRTLEGSWSNQSTHTEDSQETSVTQTMTPKLTVTSGAGGTVLSGTLAVEKKNGKTVTSSYTLHLQEDVPLDFATLTEDNSLYSVLEGAPTPLPASSISQNAEESPDASSNEYLVGTPPIGVTAFPIPQEMTPLSLEGLSEETRQALLKQMSQTLSGKLLRAAALLPQEDIALLLDGLTEEDTAKFWDMLSGL